MKKFTKTVIMLIVALSLVGGVMHASPIYACEFNPQTCPCPGC